MNQEQIFQLCDLVRQTGFEVHQYFRSGFKEKIYENSLCNRLRKQGIQAIQQVHIEVHDYDGSVVGENLADVIVEKELLLEIKATKDIIDDHVAQTSGYLRAFRLKHALILNFGAEKFQIRKLIL